MMTKRLQLVAILPVAIAMAGSWAHLFALANKMALSREDYLTVQQIYQGWALLGIAIVGAPAAASVLAWLERGSGRPFYLTLLATACIAASLVVFFSFTFPANQASENWTRLPDGWESLRRQWEYSHAAGAILHFVALASLVRSVVWRQRQ